jgi:hypothetical protein
VRQIRLATASLLLCLTLARPASAARTDVIVLVNHDRITGEVRTLTHGQLQVKTDDLGTLSIEWDKVAAVTTAGRFDIATKDGRRLAGSFGPPAAGEIGVAIVDAGGATLTLPVLDVVSFAPIGSGFWHTLDGSIDLGASYTQSSGVAQLSFDVHTAYRQPSFETTMAFSTSLTRTPDAPDSSRYSFNAAIARFIAGGWVWKPIGLLERNPDLGFELRGTTALTLGRYLVRSNRANVELGAGASVGRELPVGEEAATNVDALIGGAASFYTYDYPKTSYDVSVLVFGALKDPGRVRVNAGAKIKREVLHDFFVAITGYDAFDNRPRSADVHHNDVGFSLSLGWTF